MDVTCTVDGCEKLKDRRGLCGAHYQQWYRYGTTDLVGPQPKPCLTCGETFQPKYNRMVYCSAVCRQGESTCKTCGNKFLVKPGASGQYCSRACWYAEDRRTRPCPICETPFRSESKTCSVACGRELQRRNHPTRVANCLHCGAPIVGKKPRTKYCTRSCALRARNTHGGHTLPEGTRRVTQNGYVQVKAGGRWVMEHRLLMEQMLGRPLLQVENVHHINGHRDDNTVTGILVQFRSGNLELWSSSQPAGQRVDEKVAWAQALLQQYRPDLLAT